MTWYLSPKHKTCVDCGTGFETLKPGQKRCESCGKAAKKANQARFCAKKREETAKKLAEKETHSIPDQMTVIREKLVLEAMARIRPELEKLKSHKLSVDCHYSAAEKVLSRI